MSERELFVAGIALYWAEGSKKRRVVRFCNSDPRLIRVIMEWLKRNFNVKTNELAVHIGINEIHKPREKNC